MGSLCTQSQGELVWLKPTHKAVVEITDVRPTTRPEIVEVIVAATAKPLRLRRDQSEFYPGRVVVPLWLYLKLNQ